jgi:predicted nucleic acid-binding protein
MIVINSSPAINLTSALGGLTLLSELYGKVIVPFEVMQELEAGAHKDQTAELLRATGGVEIRAQPTVVPSLLTSTLDFGEAAVIQTALQEGVMTVVLDDFKARRVARLAGLEVTGSLGVLVQAKRAGRLPSVRAAVERLEARGAWLDDAVIARALQLAGEPPDQ